MAESLGSQFPEQYEPMTMREVQCVEDYFDPLDIQIYSHAFLTFVLELIVCWTSFNSI